ncbi:MAG: hypothetical protein ACODAQ_02715 [Phycisphaeraceae bacterium]
MSRRRAFYRCCLALLWLPAAAAAPACQSPGAEVASSDLPKVSDVSSRITSPRPSGAARLARGPRVHLAVREIEMPLEMSLEPVWEGIDESVLSPRLRAAWRANGLRIGVVRRDALVELFEEVPPPLTSRSERVITDGYPTPLRESARLKEPVTVHLGAQPDEEREDYAERGRLRLLGRAGITQRGEARLTLAPQNHRLRIALEPRDPREDVFDGRIYSEIGAGVTLAPSDVLVIGLDRPSEKEEDEEEDDEADDDDDTQGAADPDETAEAAPRERDTISVNAWRRQQRESEAAMDALPRHLGRVLMTLHRRRRPRQVLLLISAQPSHTAQSRRD